jgi:hypothetical protein
MALTWRFGLKNERSGKREPLASGAVALTPNARMRSRIVAKGMFFEQKSSADKDSVKF